MVEQERHQALGNLADRLVKFRLSGIPPDKTGHEGIDLALNLARCWSLHQQPSVTGLITGNIRPTVRKQ